MCDSKESYRSFKKPTKDGAARSHNEIMYFLVFRWKIKNIDMLRFGVITAKMRRKKKKKHFV